MQLLISCVLCILLLSVVLASQQHNYRKIPDYLRICHRSDPNLNGCVAQAIEELRPMMVSGLQDMMIPSFEPLFVSKVMISQNAGAINLQSEYTNILVSGLTNFVLRSVKDDVKSHKYRIKIWFPELQMTANYKIDGKLLMVPLAGEGTIHGNFSDINMSVSMHAGVHVLNDNEHLKVNNLFVEFDIGGASIRMENLFNGDRELGETMNTFLNENWRPIVSEMRPALEDAVAKLLQGMASKFFDAYTMEQLLPE